MILILLTFNDKTDATQTLASPIFRKFFFSCLCWVGEGFGKKPLIMTEPLPFWVVGQLVGGKLSPMYSISPLYIYSYWRKVKRQSNLNKKS